MTLGDLFRRAGLYEEVSRSLRYFLDNTIAVPTSDSFDDCCCFCCPRLSKAYSLLKKTIFTPEAVLNEYLSGPTLVRTREDGLNLYRYTSHYYQMVEIHYVFSFGYSLSTIKAVPRTYFIERWSSSPLSYVGSVPVSDTPPPLDPEDEAEFSRYQELQAFFDPFVTENYKFDYETQT